MSYQIDGSNVNTRIDWRQRPVYGGLTDRRSETFPGDGGVFVGLGEPRPTGVVMTGYLEADTIANLKPILDAEAARQADTTLRSVSYSGVTYTNQQLARFEVLSNFRPFFDGSLKIEVRVRYTWQGVTP